MVAVKDLAHWRKVAQFVIQVALHVIWGAAGGSVPSLCARGEI
jgi:hypothetical protein